MTDLDLAGLRRIAEAARELLPSEAIEYDTEQDYLAHLADGTDALLGRIESLEAERETLVPITDLEASWRVGARHAARADRAEAALARVTDDSMEEDIARVLAELEPGEAWPSNARLGGNLTGTRDDEYRAAMLDDARRVLAVIRAVAADEQEAGIDFSDPGHGNRCRCGFDGTADECSAWRSARAHQTADEQEADAVKYGTTPAERWLGADEQADKPRRIVCPEHGISDCSPLLNGCSRVIEMHRAADEQEAGR